MTLTINTSLAFNAGTPKTTGKLIVAHATDTINASAKAEATHFKNNYKKSETFVHFFVDDTSVYQSGTPGYKAWGCGNANSKAPVQVELCQFTDKERSLKAYKNFVTFLVTMAEKYGAELTLDSANKTSGIKSHDWCRKNYGGTTHVDPYDWLESLGISKAQFAADIKAGKADAKVSTTVSKPAAKAKTSTSKLAVDGMWGAGTTRRLQQVYGTPVDGVISKPSTVIKAIQRALKVTADGLRGPKTYKAMQKKAGTPADGKLSKVSPMVKYMQRQLNAGRKPF